MSTYLVEYLPRRIEMAMCMIAKFNVTKGPIQDCMLSVKLNGTQPSMSGDQEVKYKVG